MAIDYCLAYECNPKRHFGNGDCNKGTGEILERLKAKTRAQFIMRMAKQEGRDPYAISVDVITSGSDGNQIQKSVTIAELEGYSKSLVEHSADCNGCPAKCIEGSYGCIGCINYPISAQAENWLIDRLQPSGTMGAEMCFDLIRDRGINGSQAANMRQRGLFEITQAKKIILKKALFKNQSITADQLFETMFMVGNPIDPFHCFGVLLFFGALTIDGRVITDPKDSNSLAKLLDLKTQEDKAQHTQQVLGPPSDSEEIKCFESYFRAMYLSWFYEVPLLVSA